MHVKEFREKIKLSSKVIVEGKKFKIKQLVKFRLNTGDYYTKLFFTNGYVLADDLDEDMFILVKEIDTDFTRPFPKNIAYNNRNFEFSYEAEAITEEVTGEGQFKVGDEEKFWDYETEEGDYLSLGIDIKTEKRMDLIGKIVNAEKVKVLN